MYNCLSYDEPLQQQLLPYINFTQDITYMANSTNKFVYVKQDFTHRPTEIEPIKVLVNPNFNKKVFVNPNFNGNIKKQSTLPPKIHINPNVQNLKLRNDECKNNKIHINPNILRNAPVSKNDTMVEENYNNNRGQNCGKEANCTIISTRTKLVRTSAKNISETKIKKRRSSIRSQFKIIKSSLLEKSMSHKNRTGSKYKLIIKSNNKSCPVSKPVNKSKLDNRSAKIMDTSPRSKKYVYINRFLNITDIARNNLLKQNKNKLSTINIGGILYKKSENGLNITLNPHKKNNMRKVQDNGIRKSKYKFMRKSSITNSQILKQSKSSMVGVKIVIKNTSKLRVCNIPCPYYRKFGRCKGKENGKCCRKHDPDQIALCTKFLQGACIDNKCFLSHNVSPEKMPTCKFYLDGSCSREDCPYLHVRINPRADVCRDFLEGFCKKAAECEKRHQFLCPDYEKSGNCLKQRCPYPHGKMVRKYSVFNKNKFAKKSSNNCTTTVRLDSAVKGTKSENLISAENCEGNMKSRYYIGQNNLDNEGKQIDSNQSGSVERENDQESGVKIRPKLGKLPSFIAFENT
ncbi:zinc finger CCCH domain-containing protein 3 [Anoplophora glabripennis]|uniref:zinc finger CCCH domain-containing protein 3 n=1 Tax=Anoplophora glabripennis TaxID=217634 RepID=UPI0008738D39|nr:zinc finger CCCH domain-containing protein 3 [Anoplophora glabripennis]